jgi:hypothetical protein
MEVEKNLEFKFMNILFLHRLDLVHLYAPVSKTLSKNHKIIHVAFSDIEESVLKNQYDVEGDIYNLTKIRDCYFDNPYDFGSIEELDAFIIENSDGRFNLNTSIYLDRTFNNLTLKECYQVSWAYFKSWQLIFNESKPNLFFHEPPAIFFTHLASFFCKVHKAHYLTQLHVVGTKKQQWIFVEGDNYYPLEIELSKGKNYTKDKCIEVDTFVALFIKNQDILLAEVISKSKAVNQWKTVLFARRFLGLIYRGIINSLKNFEKVHPKEHIQKFLANNRKSFFVELENIHGRIFQNYFSEPNENEKYFFYPLHFEPEAVVLYYADGWYEGQIKLIENIAMQLPAGIFLYVKDHPHGGTYRDVRDYKRLLRLKNIRLIQPEISGKFLIKNSIGVITINGTAGFEALLMKKYVFCFGKAFYSNFKGVHYLNHIKNLKKAILDINLSEDNEFQYNDISSFLESSHEGFVNYFSGWQNKIGIDLNQNAEIVAIGIEKLIMKLENITN